MWKTSYKRSVIGDTGKLEDHNEMFIETNEGRLLSGMGKIDEVWFFSVLSYIREWCLETEMGISGLVGGIYVEMRHHAEETYLFAKIRHVAIILNYFANSITSGINGWTSIH